MNLQNKQQAIKAAYGEYYKDYRRFIDENGFIYQSDLFFPETGMKKDGVEAEIISVEKKHKWSNIKWRPMSLQGLENNRGWTRIESEEDMPKDKTIDVIINDECYQGYIYEGQGGLFCCVENRYNSTEIAEIIEASSVTHYQPIETPKPPIF
ncbi:hypothetical protein HZP32_05695 [Elizabethkingia anophelis]|nr:hypothetical protein [Elizabethkingia anophelis]